MVSFKFLTLATIGIASLFQEQVSAYKGWGHLIVTRIAYNNILKTKDGAGVLQRTNDILKVLNKNYPELSTKFENAWPFVESSCLADELTRRGESWQDLWHIKTATYLQDGGSLDRYPNFSPKPEQIDYSAMLMRTWVFNQGAPQNTWIQEKVIARYPTMTNDERISLVLRLLIHVMGDMH